MAKISTASEISKEFKELKEEIYKEFETEVKKLNDELVIMTPVDTGHLRDSWEEPKQVKPGVFKLSNNTVYAYQLLILGRVGKRGSFQLPLGLLPHIRSWKTKMES